MKQLEAAGRKIKMARRTSFGPNLVLEAYLLGPIDARTGMLINLIDIDKILKNVTSSANLTQSGAKLASELYMSMSQQLPQKFPGLDLRLEKVRLLMSEDAVYEVGV